ncbi:RNA polymerase-binding protein RbpA [Catellatospora tritici]|uniref:RNA polymerase-binding protein RbpA n=1 Tax=Catellatospora tritici TaxID=2851566 RepID=UPI001C2D0EF7|nr:RNA polymerase-binding protein RbpA [Catellatospora tritici]MBV1850625.1 RNA polymerase-binding protein RbpA [Catellatospora tritici]
MADRTLHRRRSGSLGHGYTRGMEAAARQTREFRCANGHLFELHFAVDIDVPSAWDCKFDGSVARLVGGPEPVALDGTGRRTPWDMLLERRSIEDLEVLLAERLAVARAKRGR